MNRNIYTSEYSVPSLSLASSRSKRAIPTKDTNTEMFRPVESKIKADIMDRINRPPIFTSKSIKQSTVSIQSTVRSNQVITETTKSIHTASLNRNVYLNRQQPIENVQLTFREERKQVERQKISNNPIKSPSSGSLLLRNPESTRTVGAVIQKKIQQKLIQANKSLFERRIAKLLSQAESYDKQLMQMYSQEGNNLQKQLLALQQCRKQALSFDLGPNFVKI